MAYTRQAARSSSCSWSSCLPLLPLLSSWAQACCNTSRKSMAWKPGPGWKTGNACTAWLNQPRSGARYSWSTPSSTEPLCQRPATLGPGGLLGHPGGNAGNQRCRLRRLLHRQIPHPALLGVPDDQLRIVYVKALELNQAHMVVAWYPTPTPIRLSLITLLTRFVRLRNVTTWSRYTASTAKAFGAYAATEASVLATPNNYATGDRCRNASSTSSNNPFTPVMYLLRRNRSWFTLT